VFKIGGTDRLADNVVCSNDRHTVRR